MSHGDYECCAICDSKTVFKEGSLPKKDLCTHCAVELSLVTGLKIKDAYDVDMWMLSEAEQPKKVLDILKELRFSECGSNSTDTIFMLLKTKAHFDLVNKIQKDKDND